jgi:exopolysaccharide biosynthesis predicted pyruvyltransferase EpsI
MDNFEKFLAQNCDKYMSVITPGGNHGDTLIHMALIKKLNMYDIKYTCFNLEQMYGTDLLLGAKYLINIALWKIGSDLGFQLLKLSPKTELILFEGGGYMNDVWYGPTLLTQILKHNNSPIAIAPQSYLFNRTNFENYFKNGRTTILFCREKYSFQHLKEKEFPSNVSIFISPELALYLTKEDLKKYIEPRSGNYQLIAFRADKESLLRVDLKREIIENSSNPLISDISTKNTLTDFISIIYNAEKIYTDRLHVAIIAHLLDKPATLFGNKYHKNRGVWEFSLRDKIEYIEANRGLYII